MKKFSLLMALILCIGCVLFTACNNDKPDDSEDTTEITTDAGEVVGGDESTSDTDGTADTSDVVVDASNDAVANDIYDNVGPEIYG